ncbi:MAG: apolipoprotein N-acyltransferase [Candidatus Latescibacteria bacterium]|nr:apolipoprotein N-acyltransferase [Candidatus Latescibacterota bacterium]
MSKKAGFIYALFSALFLCGAYPPYYLGYFAFVGLVPLFNILRNCSLKRVLFWTWVNGLLFLGFSLFWIRHITWIGMILAVPVLAFFYALPFVICKIIYDVSPRFGFIILPFAVAGVEWIRSFDALAFPWMILGNSQAGYPFFIQFADITSAYGVSSWVVLVNISVYLLIRKKTIRRWLLLSAFIILPTLYSLTVIHTGRKNNEKSLTVALIQGNVMPEDKWSDGSEYWNINLYRTMSIESMKNKPDLIVWPETATPVYLLESPGYRNMVQSLVDSLGVPVVTGTPSMDLDTGQTWNSAAYFIPDDSPQAYRKIHLVPFGEAFPLDNLFPALRNIDLGQANWDEGTERVIFTSIYLPNFCTLICFESIFPDLVRSFVKKGVEFIVIVTNDVWFGPRISPEQHAMISVLRAIEFHKPVVRCANTGISMIIDPFGRIVKKTAAYERTTITSSIKPNDVETFYMRFGNIFSVFSFFITLTGMVVCIYLRIRHSARNR